MKHVAIFGLGNDIDEHITQIKRNENFMLTGIYGHNTIAAKKIADRYDIKCYAYPLDAIGQNDIIDFVNPHILDIENAKLAIKCNKNIFLEERFLINANRAQELLSVNREAGVDIFIAIRDFHNPMIIKAMKCSNNPSFIEIRRSVNSNKGELDSSEQLMQCLHQEITLTLGFINANCKKISVNSDTSNLIHARLEFDNAACVSINISNIATKKYRELSVFNDEGLLYLDIQNSDFNSLTKDGMIKYSRKFEKRDNYLENSLIAFDKEQQIGNRFNNLDEATKALSILDQIEGKISAFAI
ncbi:MAG: hypothetical protein KAG84_03570 [Bacteroidales bacterium]|nr:hypothetical protein [Bacteroidales bacterium]